MCGVGSPRVPFGRRGVLTGRARCLLVLIKSEYPSFGIINAHYIEQNQLFLLITIGSFIYSGMHIKLDRMIPFSVIEDIVEEYSRLIESEKVVHRDITHEVEKSLELEEVTVVKGVRRAGKTFLLYELFQKHGGLYINFEDDRLHGFAIEDFERLHDIAIRKGAKIIFLDEVQEVEGWEKYAHRAHRRIKIVVTGSNSRLLGSDYSNALVGRTKSYSVFPLSYKEFLRFRSLDNERNSLLEYMDVGGFPRIVLTDDTGLAREYLDSIIYRDLVGRHDIRNPQALRTLILFLLSNIGKEFSYRSLKTVTGLKHDQTIKEYIGLLEDVFLLETIKRFSPSLKKQATYGKKIYAVDPAFIHIGKRENGDHGRILENIVYLHLKRSGYDLYFGMESKEVDFIIAKGLRPLKVANVTYMADDEQTRVREISSLNYFMNAFKVPAEMISLYPFDTPQNIQFHLAFRYLVTKAY